MMDMNIGHEYLSIKYDGFIPVKQDPPIGHQPHRSSKHIALHRAPCNSQLLGTQSMIYPDHILLDNLPFIEIAGYEMRRSSNNLYSTVIRLVVWPSTLEGRQEAVMNIDDASRHVFA